MRPRFAARARRLGGAKAPSSNSTGPASDTNAPISNQTTVIYEFRQSLP